MGGEAYDLVEALGSTETRRASTDNENVDVAEDPKLAFQDKSLATLWKAWISRNGEQWLGILTCRPLCLTSGTVECGGGSGCQEDVGLEGYHKMDWILGWQKEWLSGYQERQDAVNRI